MSATTGGWTGRNFEIELSTDGSSWTSWKSHSNKVSDASGKRPGGAVKVSGQDYPIVSTGIRDEVTPKFTFVRTETAGEPWALVKTAFEADSLLYVRWSPKGGSTGQKRYACSGYVTDCPYPAPDATNTTVQLFEFAMICDTVTESTIP